MSSFVVMNVCCAPVQDETSLHWLVSDEEDQSNQIPESQFPVIGFISQEHPLTTFVEPVAIFSTHV